MRSSQPENTVPLSRLVSTSPFYWRILTWITPARLTVSLVLPVIVGVAVALRLASALYQGDTVSALPGIYDQISYDLLARRLQEGHGFTFPADWWPVTRAGEPTAHWSYLYTLYLSAVYTIFGPHPIAARLLQAVVAGVLHPLLAWRIGHRLFGMPVGLVSAGLTAVYSYFIYYSGALMTETFYMVTILWTLDVATGMLREPGTRNLRINASPNHRLSIMKPWFFLGLAVGITVLLRQVFLIFVPILFAWLFWSLTRSRRSNSRNTCPNISRNTIIGLCVSMLVIAALMLPWTMHNYQVFGRFVLLNTNSGYAFFWANHPIHGDNFVAILPSSTYRDLIPGELRDLDEAALDQALLTRGIRFVLDDPIRYARLSFNRIKDYFSFLPSTESGVVSNVARVTSFGILMPFMLVGLFLPVISGRWRVTGDRSAMVSLLYVFILTYSLIHLLSWALIRYRLPVDAISIIFSALALLSLLAGLLRHRGQRT